MLVYCRAFINGEKKDSNVSLKEHRIAALGTVDCNTGSIEVDKVLHAGVGWCRIRDL